MANLRTPAAVFQSAPLTEARGDSPPSISAPLTEARGDTCHANVACGRFNPLPSPKQGETGAGLAPLTEARGDLGKGIYVSIRSPHRSKGRRQQGLALFQSAPLTEARGDVPMFTEACETSAFQSAPLTEARGDLLILALEAGRPCGKRCFQSAPLTEARGDPTAQGLRRSLFQSAPLTEARGDSPMLPASIRSPHRSPSRHQQFQSAPLTEARGDRPSWPELLMAGRSICFNPLPSPKQGETCMRI